MLNGDFDGDSTRPWNRVGSHFSQYLKSVYGKAWNEHGNTVKS